MDLIEQVKEDSQMLFDKRDVLKLLEKQKAEDIEKACEWLNADSAKYIEYDNGIFYVDVKRLVNKFKQAMKGE